MSRLAASLLLVAAACGAAGPDAPAPGAIELICDEAVCLTYPGDWSAEPGDGYIGFTNHAAPDTAAATAAVVNMEAIASAAGLSWPVPPEEVAAAFWQLLADGGGGELGSLERRIGGGIESSGTAGEVRLWHLLVPIDTSHAIAVEVRGPNRTWERHAEVFFSEVAPAP